MHVPTAGVYLQGAIGENIVCSEYPQNMNKCKE